MSTQKKKRKASQSNLSPVGDAFVRELDVSRITLRLVDKADHKDDKDDHTIAKLTGDTLPTLQRCLVSLDAPKSMGFANDW